MCVQIKDNYMTRVAQTTGYTLSCITPHGSTLCFKNTQQIRFILKFSLFFLIATRKL